MKQLDYNKVVKLWKSMSENGALISSAVWTLIWVKEDWRKESDSV